MKGTKFVYPERTITSIHIRNFNEAAAPPLREQALVVLRSLAQATRVALEVTRAAFRGLRLALVLFRAPHLLNEEFKKKKGGFFREKL